MYKGRFGREMGDIDDEEAEDICAGCGTDEAEWQGNQGQGYRKNGQKYCCKDCAEDIICNCGF